MASSNSSSEYNSPQPEDQNTELDLLRQQVQSLSLQLQQQGQHFQQLLQQKDGEIAHLSQQSQQMQREFQQADVAQFMGQMAQTRQRGHAEPALSSAFHPVPPSAPLPDLYHAQLITLIDDRNQQRVAPSRHSTSQQQQSPA